MYNFLASSRRKYVLGGTFLLLIFLLIAKFDVLASFGSWGDNSLIHACKDQQGKVTIVGSSDSCAPNETQVTWLKDVDAGSGLSINRTSSGAVLSLAGSSQAYQVNPTDEQTTTSTSYVDMTNGTQQIVLSHKSIVQVNAQANAFLAPLPVLDLNDKTANGNSLTNNGAAEYTINTPFAASTVATDFESTESDKFTAVDSASLSSTSNITMEMWIKLESIPAPGQYMIFISKSSGSIATNSYAFGLQNNSGTIRFYGEISDGTNQDPIFQNWTPSLGTWYHVAFVFTGASSKYQFFVDGNQVGSDQTGTAAGLVDANNSLIIGAYNASSPSFYYDGVMDEVRIWNIVRTPTEINNNKSVELTGIESGLVAYYPLESLASNLGYIRTTYDSGGADTEIGKQGYTNVTSDGQSISAGGVAVLDPGTYTVAMQKKVNASGETATYKQPSMSIVIIPNQ
jgi:hypothetical protein